MNAPTTYRSFIRPSFLPVLAECPAAAQMTFYFVQTFGEPDEADVMALGTDMHACVVMALYPLMAGGLPATDEVLAKFPSFSGWDQACVRRCVEFAVELLRKTRNDYPDEDVQILLEHHLDGSVLGIDRGGSADLVIVVPFRHLRIVDWKCGFLDQGEAADHDQLAAYGVMGAATFKTKTVEVYLFQPRADVALRASGARFAAAELRATETWTRAVVEDATSDDPELRAGFHCTKCRAVTRCAAAKEFIMRLKEAVAKIAAANDPKAWCELIDSAKVAGKFSDDAIEQAKGHLIAGGQVELWSLKPGQINRKIDPQQAIALAKDVGLLHLLLEHAAFKTSAIDAVPAIGPAVSQDPKAPTLQRVKASSGAKA